MHMHIHVHTHTCAGEGLVSEGNADSDCVPRTNPPPHLKTDESAHDGGGGCHGGGSGGGSFQVLKLPIPIVPGGRIGSTRMGLAEVVGALEEWWRRGGESWSQVEQDGDGEEGEEGWEGGGDVVEEDGAGVADGWCGGGQVFEAVGSHGVGTGAHSGYGAISNCDGEIVLEGTSREDSAGGCGGWRGVGRGRHGGKRGLESVSSDSDSDVLLAGGGGEYIHDSEVGLLDGLAPSKKVQGADGGPGRRRRRQRENGGGGITTDLVPGADTCNGVASASLAAADGGGDTDEVAGSAPPSPLPIEKVFLLFLLCAKGRVGGNVMVLKKTR